jgi:hypothetical protein
MNLIGEVMGIDGLTMLAVVQSKIEGQRGAAEEANSPRYDLPSFASADAPGNTAAVKSSG